MKLAVRKNGGLPSLLSDFFGPSSVLGTDLLDLDSGFFSSRLGINVPTANITETPKAYSIELAAPGLERKDFNVEVNNHTLTISAEKKEERKEEEGEYYRREYSFNSFCRTFTLPENVKESDIDAKYNNGVLTLQIPKMKETQVKPVKKIAVA
jgi:HSP20 family protein